MSYTPGPWKWDGYTDRWAEPSRLTSEKSLVISLNDRFSGYDECCDDLRMDVSEGDRALIAAAPELLEALKEANESLVARGMDTSCGLGKRISEAIRKAEGGVE